MPDQTSPLIDQLIAQQTARQGHPLAPVPAATPPPSQPAIDPRLAGLIHQLFGDGPEAQQGAQQLKMGQLPSEAVGNVYGRKGDIELTPPMKGLVGQ